MAREGGGTHRDCDELAGQEHQGAMPWDTTHTGFLREARYAFSIPDEDTPRVTC
jgi:hypothetical protein